MTLVDIVSWAAWSPGIETEADWRRWAPNPCALERDGAPAISFVPAMVRRRCDQLSRMTLEVIQSSTQALELTDMRSVFASRHGSFATMISMLEDLSSNSSLSPNRFSHSVHNTQAGLYSIIAKNVQASTSIAARQETFAHGFLEAVSLLHQDSEGAGPILLVTGDEATPNPVEALADNRNGAYALALVLNRSSGDHGVSLRIEEGAEFTPSIVPDALRFLRWTLSEEPELRISYPKRTWVWTRH
jgi:hypothetical protein